MLNLLSLSEENPSLVIKLPYDYRVDSRHQAGGKKFHHEGSPPPLPYTRQTRKTGRISAGRGGRGRGTCSWVGLFSGSRASREPLKTPLFQVPYHVRGKNEYGIVAFVNSRDVTAFPSEPLKKVKVLQRQVPQLTLEISLDDVAVVFSLNKNSLIKTRREVLFQRSHDFSPRFRSAPLSRSCQGPSVFKLTSWSNRQLKKFYSSTFQRRLGSRCYLWFADREDDFGELFWRKFEMLVHFVHSLNVRKPNGVWKQTFIF